MKPKVKESAAGITARLEREGKFDVDYLPRSEKFIMPDENFRYVKKGILYRFSCKCVRTATFLLGPVVCKAAYGLKVRGRENLKGINGAICVCNHVSVIDTLFVKQAVGHYRSFHTGAPWNNRKGLGGAILRRGGFLSLGGSFSARKNFNVCLGELLKKGAIVNFYPEEALWQRYEKPRPLKTGAFKTAASFGVPVIPLFVTFEGKRKRAAVNILEPIFCDENLSVRENAEQLCNRCAKLWKETYEKIYGRPLVYDTADFRAE